MASRLDKAQTTLHRAAIDIQGGYDADTGARVGGNSRLRAAQDRADYAMGGYDPDAYRGYAAQTGAAQQRWEGQAAQDRAQQLAARGQQAALAQQYGALPSVVDQQAQQGRAALARALASQAGSQPGGWSPAGARAALLARGQGEAQIASQAALARAQEQRSALDAQAGLAGQIRAGDLSAAQLTPQMAALAQRAAAQQGQLTGMGDTAAMQLTNLANQRENMLYNNYFRALGLEYGLPQEPGIWEQIGGIVGTVGGIAPELMPVSDSRAKESVSDDRDAVDELLDELAPYGYDYRDPSQPGAREGRQHGVMAQDLEKSEIGRTLVRMGDDGYRRVDYSPATLGPVVLSAMARLNERLTRLEK